ncbi:MAG: hypothetical protein GY869_15210 [Planctomycetes bacterium]|nr:hypothetical protein [Planctomycetota bacterium]
MLERPLSVELMYAILDIINQTLTGLERDDPTLLRLVEIRPRSEEFADVVLSCSVSPNDPDDPGGWLNEEAAWPGNVYNPDASRSPIEMTSGQWVNFRYTVDFTLFYQDFETPLSPEEAMVASQTILTRIHSAIIVDGEAQAGKSRFAELHRGDPWGNKLVWANKAVKKSNMLPRGSAEEAFYKGKMWLQFGVYMEPEEIR